VTGSYRQINYSLRPAKATERKMICEVLRRLYPFGKIETYRYVGFGSIYFSDFLLFHRALGMDDMLSIEKDAYAKECFEFNKPYNCVRVDYRPASEVLPELAWRSKTIVWLDYESKLDEIVLSDIESVCAKAPSGSVLLVTVNIQADVAHDETTQNEYTENTGLSFNIDDYRLHELRKRLGENVPPEVKGSDLRGKGLAVISHKVLNSIIEKALSARNGVLPKENKVIHRQIVYFQYNDGAPMLTIGWIFYEDRDTNKLDACSFSELNFVRHEDVAYTIKIPCLTMKEMRHLNTQLPKGEAVNLPGVPKSDIESYAELYRYFPAFVEAIFT